MQKISTKSNGFLPEKQNRQIPAKAQERHNKVVQTWQANFKGDLVISNSEITIQTGLQEVRLFQLAKTQSEKDLISLIALQITDLIEFLGKFLTFTINATHLALEEGYYVIW